MKLTTYQLSILKRMAAGEELMRSEWSGYSYWLQHFTKDEDLIATTVSIVTARKLIRAGYIVKGQYDGALRWFMELTDAGREQAGGMEA